MPKNERDALGILVVAAKVFDALYLRQVWEGNETMLLQLAQDMSPLGLVCVLNDTVPRKKRAFLPIGK